MKKTSLIVLSSSQYEDDEMTIYANKSGLQELKKRIEQVLQGEEPDILTIKRGKAESHDLVISISNHDDFPSEYD